MLIDNLSDLTALLIRVNPNAEQMLNTPGHHSYVKIACEVALNLWLEEAEETEDTKELRHQLKHLNEKGHWDLEAYQP
jgi:hypothetical protein